MNTWNWLLHFLIIFDLVAFGIYFGGDILFTAIRGCRKTRFCHSEERSDVGIR